MLEEFGDHIDVEWRSYLLRPEPQDKPMDKFTQYTESWARPADAEPSVTFNRWSGEHQPPSHSMPSAIGGKVAETFGPELWDAFHHRLLKAYFDENRTISELDVMADVAAEVGIDAAEFRTRYDAQAPELAGQVIADHNSAIESGITGVPCVLVNDEFPILGAQETDFYRQVATRLIERGA